MVSIIENWAIIIGLVVSVSGGGPDSRFEDWTVEIKQIESFEDYPMLLVQKPGDRVIVRVSTAVRQRSAYPCGKQVSIRVRRGSDPQLLFAHPDWSLDTEGH